MLNLIRNTLLSVLCVQLLAFSYIKSFSEKTVSKLTYPHVVAVTDTKVKKNTTKKNHITRKKVTISKVIQVSQVPQKKFYTPIKSKTINKYAKKPSSNKKPLKKIPNTNSKVEKYAKQFLGNKYVWGATGPKTFDCSGFTQKVYKQCAGIHIPRVSREQQK